MRLGIKALAAAASVAVMTMGMAGHASAATPITVTDVEMYQGYTATIGGEDAWTNIMRFSATNNLNNQPVSDLFGFCIDIYHNIGVGGGQGLPFLDTKGEPPPLITTNFNGTPNNLLAGQVKAMSDLVDTGYLLYVNNVGKAGEADMWLQEAAIQAAIWKVENPLVDVHMDNPDATVAGDLTTVGEYFTKFTTPGGYNPADYGVTAQDSVFTILSQSGSQSFAIGWPGGVPEPTTWALMLAGFGGMGAMLRRQRKAAAVTA